MKREELVRISNWIPQIMLSVCCNWYGDDGRPRAESLFEKHISSHHTGIITKRFLVQISKKVFLKYLYPKIVATYTKQWACDIVW